MESFEPESKFVEVNGVRLCSLDWGGSGAPIVILHATGFLGRIYRPIAEQLRAIGHVYSFDQRGHGDSGKAPDGEYNWELTMRDLAGFIDAMGWKSVRAFGHSAGATAIGSLGAERPDLILRSVLVEPVIFESPTGPELGWQNPFFERTLKRKRSFPSVDAMVANFDRKPPYDTWRKDILHDYCEFGTRRAADGTRELKCAPEIEARIYETSHEFDGLARILASDIPMLVLFGANSYAFSVTLTDRVRRGIRHGRVLTIPDTGHFMPMEQPDFVARQALDFLGA
ncbi:MAG TPA: alpha/beta hydrolase [Candidatus Binataceae bacterium]|nr:alpha/beta hydrolase [Candidatus Binataceae bacterium]